MIDIMQDQRYRNFLLETQQYYGLEISGGKSDVEITIELDRETSEDNRMFSFITHQLVKQIYEDMRSRISAIEIDLHELEEDLDGFAVIADYAYGHISGHKNRKYFLTSSYSSQHRWAECIVCDENYRIKITDIAQQDGIIKFGIQYDPKKFAHFCVNINTLKETRNEQIG